MVRNDRTLSSDYRNKLLQKTKGLYEIYCRTRGQSICVETFLIYLIWNNESYVVHDFLRYLDVKTDSLRSRDPDDQLELTLVLAASIRQQLQTETKRPPPRKLWAKTLREKKRVLGVKEELIELSAYHLLSPIILIVLFFMMIKSWIPFELTIIVPLLFTVGCLVFMVGCLVLCFLKRLFRL